MIELGVKSMDRTIQAVMLQSFKKFSDYIAIEYGNDKITYRTLDERSNYVASILIKREEQKKKVGIFLDNRMDFIISMIGILRAGDIFIPFDKNMPKERLQYMLEMVHCDYIITDEENEYIVSEYIQDQSKIIIYKSVEDIESAAQANKEYGIDDPIYIFFTSGTTNRPKAILGKNKSLVQFIQWESKLLSLGEQARVSQLTFPAYDAILRDIFLPLFVGGTICIPSKRDIVLDSYKLSVWLEKNFIQVIHCTPTIFRNCRKEMLHREYPKLQYILLAGEVIYAQELKSWYETFGERIQLINLYGPSETTMIKTYYYIKSSDKESKKIPIGRPMDGTKVHILDENGNTCDVNTEGEIYIETEYMTLGYYGNEKLTKERFVRKRIDNKEEITVYRTGDYGFYQEDGNIEYCGRKDRQVKKLGNRIDLSEIEDVITTHEEIEYCYVEDSKSESDSNITFVAYCIAHSPIQKESLMAYLKEKLPYYMLPNEIIFVTHIPVGSSGKTDVSLLKNYRLMNEENHEKQEMHEQPKDEIEAKILSIWSDILGTEEIGVTDNFLFIGGHSLQLMMMISKIYEMFEIELSLEFVFEHPCIIDIADYIRKEKNHAVYNEVEIVEDKKFYPLTPAQKRIFISEQLDDKGTAYHLTNVFLMNRALDLQRLQYAAERLVDRHASLRTSFDIVDGEMCQEIHSQVAIKVSCHECREAELDEYLQTYITLFDFTCAPLFRIGLLKLSDTKKSAIVIDMHHLISDGKSARIVLRDLLMLYNAQNSLPELTYRYVDYVYWFQKELSIKKSAAEEYWLEALKDLKFEKGLPLDYPLRKERSYRGASVFKEFPHEMLTQLHQFVKDSNTTLFIFLFSAFSVLYGKYTALEDVVIGSPVEGRKNHKFEDVVGMFVNVLPIRCKVEKNKTFLDYLMEMKSIILKSFEYDDYQIDDLLLKLHAKDNLNGRYLFDTLFSLQYFEELSTEGMDNAFEYHDYTKIESENLRTIIYSIEDRIYVTFRYSQELFFRETIEHMMNDYFKVIETVLEYKNICLQDIPLYELRQEETALSMEFDF